jgi:hypothetical protein|tara:strand:+ start:9708 stop:9968 length:261 start_codon:yes stop_codon:yes gene_type:complete
MNLEAYAEYGAIGVIIMLFIGMIKFLQTSLTAKLTQVEGICIKLIDRWNRSDEVRDRRHEQLIDQVNRITDDINYLKGRVSMRDRD